MVVSCLSHAFKIFVSMAIKALPIEMGSHIQGSSWISFSSFGKYIFYKGTPTSNFGVWSYGSKKLALEIYSPCTSSVCVLAKSFVQYSCFLDSVDSYRYLKSFKPKGEPPLNECSQFELFCGGRTLPLQI